MQTAEYLVRAAGIEPARVGDEEPPVLVGKPMVRDTVALAIEASEGC
jgi:hypothetical protein